jgi:hypothetical protein
LFVYLFWNRSAEQVSTTGQHTGTANSLQVTQQSTQNIKPKNAAFKALLPPTFCSQKSNLSDKGMSAISAFKVTFMYHLLFVRELVVQFIAP